MRVPTRILFICFPEYGASNCHLAAIESLKALHEDDVEIHMASLAAMASKCPSDVTFHQVRGISITEYLVTGPNGFLNHPGMFAVSPVSLFTQPLFQPFGENGGKEGSIAEVVGGKNFFSTSTTFWGFLKSVLDLPTFFALNPPDEYLETVKDYEEVISRVDPDVVVVDPAYAQSRDAGIASKRRMVILSPNTITELGMAAQGAGVFSFPTPGTGLPYPLTSIWMKIRNVISLIFMGVYLSFNSRVRALVRARNNAGYPGQLPTMNQEHEGPTICMTTPSLDRPMIVPKDLFCLGPILRLATLDPDDEIVKWTQKAPTVFINLGSISKTSEKDANVTYLALGVLLRQKPDVQVLWKLAKRTPYQLPADDFGGRLRIVEWLEMDPAALLRSGKIVCSVNHGGSNSYHEALSAGVPQVICSGWYDCHDFGSRLAMLGIGRWGNRVAAPGVEVHELANALLDVVGSEKYSAKASAAAEEIRRCSRAKWEELYIAPFSWQGEVEGKDIAAEFVYRTATGEKINGWP